jgi:hypothetical protein
MKCYSSAVLHIPYAMCVLLKKIIALVITLYAAEKIKSVCQGILRTFTDTWPCANWQALASPWAAT